jgi:hypothetical protein
MAEDTTGAVPGVPTAGPVCPSGLSSHAMLFVLDNYDSFTYNLVQ